jgi:acetylornithine/LysW-gamma-L-lysine aminotransferase
MCAAAEAAIRAMRDEHLAEEAAAKGARFMESIRALHLGGVKEVRGRGLMIGVQLNRDLKEVLGAFDERGFLALRAGEDVLRMLPPVVSSDGDFAEALSHLKAVLA